MSAPPSGRVAPAAPRAGRAARAPKPRERRPRAPRPWILTLFAAPGLLVVLAFHYYPLLGNVIAFKDYLPFIGVWDSEWVGAENFRVILDGDARFWNAVRNTLVITGVQTVLVFPLPIMLALLLNSLVSERIRRIVQSITYLPHFLSWVVIVAIFQTVLGGSGSISQWLREHGHEGLDIIGNADVFVMLLTAQVTWKDTGWATILFLAALSQISTQLYESSAVDGAGRWRQLWHVTLPGLRGIIVLLFILQLGNSLTVGFEQLILQEAAVGIRASEVLDTYVYNTGVISGHWGEAAAVGLVKGVIGVALVLTANRIAHRFGEAGVYQR